ncbi:MAG: Sialic acid TRAP transporter permease protein SiaT [Smithella sp. PtaU1.Bin162]|nr:MAG: Sialic acid TRAP transporter permease protein SiaT [Smithella sp. PtaU1.Bin162]
MSPEQIFAVAMFFVLLTFVILGVHLAFALMFIGLVGGLIFMGPAIFPMVVLQTFDVMESEVLIAVPLFVFMGTILEKSGIAENVYQALYELFGPVRGGLAIATIVTCTVFAACTGVIAATVTAMTLIAIPSMLKRRYDKGLASGVVCAGGSLGILIPPSVMLVMYGPMANLSVAKLFAAALLPGILLALLYLVYVILRCWLQPSFAPAIPKEERPPLTWQLIRRSIYYMIPTVVLLLAVLGSIMSGIASPTEASGVGAFFALLIAAAYRALSLKNIKESAYSTLIVSVMVFFIIIGAGMFNAVFLYLGGGTLVKSILIGLPFGKWFVLFIMMFILFIGGFFISWQALLFIVVPIFLPVANGLGFDPLWFALLVCVNLQMSFLTPPFAYSIFFVKGAAPPEVTTWDIYWGVIPFVFLQAVGLFLCVVFPEIILWLPRVTLGG